MENKFLRILSLVGGLLLAILGLLWTLSLSIQGQLAENAGPVIIIVSVGLICVIIGWKE
ncbi:MAG: hypothetical protein NWE90_08015 [Candidatus Bathyarchaeota archaeon]|nr:hypothetical protein [Candidatus Bathyarchaeota archaeon]